MDTKLSVDHIISLCICRCFLAQQRASLHHVVGTQILHDQSSEGEQVLPAKSRCDTQTMARRIQQVPSALGNGEFLPEEERPRHHVSGFCVQIHQVASLDIFFQELPCLQVADTPISLREKKQMHVDKTLSLGQVGCRVVRVCHCNTTFSQFYTNNHKPASTGARFRRKLGGANQRLHQFSRSEMTLTMFRL